MSQHNQPPKDSAQDAPETGAVRLVSENQLLLQLLTWYLNDQEGIPCFCGERWPNA
ncbi:MAG: hypothetical protein JRI97_13370, partial [Deltaproteobacteria bacterium]|nr:hypothetical protein [Deltaproteobacteria bacterium]